MHLLPAERSEHRVIDGERVCEAIAALGSAAAMEARARDFAVLGDPTRLSLLTCIRAAGPISVSDLAAATGCNDTTVSQTRSPSMTRCSDRSAGSRCTGPLWHAHSLYSYI